MAYNILSRQIWKLQNERGMDYESAKMLAYNQQKRLGRTQTGTFRLSEEGVAYSNLTPAQRAIIRAAKKGTGNVNDYTYLDGKVKKRRGVKNA